MKLKDFIVINLLKLPGNAFMEKKYVNYIFFSISTVVLLIASLNFA